MKHLPVELKQHICSVLDYEDLKSIRLVNKECAHVAVLYLFRRISVTPICLERLRLIAQHKVFATCIKEVDFYADLLPSIPPEIWHERLVRGSRPWTTEEESFRFQNYVLVYHEQQRLRENNHKLSREIIDWSIPKLRGLQWIRVFTGENSCLRNEKDNKRFPNQQWSKAWNDLRIHALDNGGALLRGTEISTQLTNLLNALATSDVHIRKLSIWNVSVSIWQSGLQHRPEAHCAALRTLKTLFLENSKEFSSTADVKTLGMLLERAQSLQTLKLHWNGNKFSQTDILQCFRPSLPRLSRLSLFDIRTTEKNLIETLQGYRATLTKLELVHISLTDRNTGPPFCSWHHFFRDMPEILPHLRKIHLRLLQYKIPRRGRWSRSQLESPYLEAVEHAIMNGTEMPQST